MKKTLALTLIFFIVIISLASCKEKVTGLWEDAVYTEDTALGEGSITFTLKVTAEKNTVTFTVSTDKDNLEDALLALDLIAGDEGEFGLYVKTVNGITVDYDECGMYWALYEGGTLTSTGAGGITVKDGDEYEFKAE